jgi:DNA uptake protein ComE-like DNA-binding protein
VLITIIALEVLYLNFSDILIRSEVVDFAQFEKQVQTLEAALQNENHKNNLEKENAGIDESVLNKNALIATYFIFNPNNLSIADWQRLGLSEKQIHVIKNYEAKGGKFLTKLDVKKMYCISQKQYLQLEPYISIPPYQSNSAVHDVQSTVLSFQSKIKNSKSVIVELNTADSTQLEQLKGIGAFYANAIIKLRNSLGGFVAKNQLLELWKFDESKLKLIEENITVDVTKVKKKNINILTSKELKHPYLKWNQVNAIVNYKNKHGNYRSVEEIRNTDLIDEETFLKISPYLTVE